MTDRFTGQSSALDAPASHAFAVTPHDATPLPETTRGLFVGGPGSVAVTMASGVDATFTSLVAGAILPVRATHVKATGTTATAILGLV